MKFPKSKSGWFFVVTYLCFAVVLFYKAMTCGSMMCDLEAWPVVVPIGIVYGVIIRLLDKIYFFGTSYTNFSLGNHFFVILTITGNLVCYYWFGVFAGWIVKKILPKKRENI